MKSFILKYRLMFFNFIFLNNLTIRLKKLYKSENKSLLLLIFILVYCSCEGQSRLPLYHFQLPEDWKDKGKISEVNDDNKIYQSKKIFSFDYQYKSFNKQEVISTIDVKKLKDGPIPWKLVHKGKEKIEDYPVEHIDLIVYQTKTTRTNFLGDQTIIRYKYYNREGEIGFGELTGLVEDSSKVWIHPPRSFAFEITEFNPFPEVIFPLTLGKTWARSISIPEEWTKNFDFKINGVTSFNITYQIASKKIINTKLGLLECYIIEATGKGELGETNGTFYFNEEKGFIKIDFVNIDKSLLTLELTKINGQ